MVERRGQRETGIREREQSASIIVRGRFDQSEVRVRMGQAPLVYEGLRARVSQLERQNLKSSRKTLTLFGNPTVVDGSLHMTALPMSFAELEARGMGAP